MKSTSLKTLLSSAALAVSLMAVPMATYAADATSTTSLRINDNGIVHVLGVEVTSISGNIINAITHFRDTIANWAFTTNASTTIAANSSLTATTSDVHIGDRLNVTGALTSIGSTFGVAATKIIDVTSMGDVRAKSGTVQSVSTSTGSFVMKSEDKLITVQTNVSTIFSLGGTASTLASLPIDSKVFVAGTSNADGTIIIASKVVLKNAIGGFMGMMGRFYGDSLSVKNEDGDNEDQNSNGMHGGFLKSNMRTDIENGNDR